MSDSTDYQPLDKIQYTLDETEKVNHPAHYAKHPSGIEAIQVTEWMNFNLGNAMKYLWRAGKKDDTVLDLLKAKWYIDREVRRIKKMREKEVPSD